MTVSNYIQIMKDNRPEKLDTNNIYQQFYETHEKVLELLVRTKQITKSQSERLFLVSENIVGEIILHWLGPDFELICRRKDTENDLIYYKVSFSLEPKTYRRHFFVKTNKVSETETSSKMA